MSPRRRTTHPVRRRPARGGCSPSEAVESNASVLIQETAVWPFQCFDRPPGRAVGPPRSHTRSATTLPPASEHRGRSAETLSFHFDLLLSTGARSCAVRHSSASRAGFADRPHSRLQRLVRPLLHLAKRLSTEASPGLAW